MPRRRPPLPDPKAGAASPPPFTCFYRPPIHLGLLDSADAGDPDAQYELGRLYLEGRAEASRSSRQGSEEQSVVAEFTPAVERNHIRATELLQKAADQGHEGARQLLEVAKLHSPKGVH